MRVTRLTCLLLSLMVALTAVGCNSGTTASLSSVAVSSAASDIEIVFQF